MTAAYLKVQAMLVLVTIGLFLAMVALNEWVFRQLEFVPGINWVYLPAGMRLLCTLLFAEAGAIGLLAVSWGVSFLYFFPDEPARAFMGGIIATVAPWGVYVAARRRWGLRSSLANLTAGRLLVLCLAYSVASPLLHHLWFAWRGDANVLSGFLVMFVGDLTGTLIVIYTLKALLALAPRPAPAH